MMTTDERVQAVVDFGFTERQARFLVLVMRHAGVCVPRQYARFAGIAHGGRSATPSSTSSSDVATPSPATASTTARGSITSITSRCTTPSGSRRAATVGRCRRAWRASA